MVLLSEREAAFSDQSSDWIIVGLMNVLSDYYCHLEESNTFWVVLSTLEEITLASYTLLRGHILQGTLNLVLTPISYV